MVINKSSLIKKRNSFTHKKRFSEKIILTSLPASLKLFLSKNTTLSSQLDLSNILNIKTSLYTLLKEYKKHKRQSFDSSSEFSIDNLNDFGLKLQSSGFYLSPVELRKLNNFHRLQLRILDFYINCLFTQSKKSELSPHFNKDNSVALEEFSIKNAYTIFNKKPKNLKFVLNSELIQKNKEGLILKSSSILRKKYNRFIESRLFLFFDSYKKSYKKVFPQSKRIRLTLRQLFGCYNKVRFNYLKKSKHYYKDYKKLVWKRKKRKNRKKTGLLRFLRRRRRLLFQFYVPRHLEINYKTFEIMHLGFFDLSTTNSRIPYWLNLRRLLTFLSL